MRVAKYVPYAGGCESIEIPERLKKSKALISLKTHTDCFMYSILACLHPKTTNAQRIASYRQYENLYNFSDVRGIVPITAISSFELKNPTISVNVYSYEFNETKNIIPLRISKAKKEKHVNLLLHKDHYYLIKNFNRFMGGSTWRSLNSSKTAAIRRTSISR